jgi:hypothetical protein
MRNGYFLWAKQPRATSILAILPSWALGKSPQHAAMLDDIAETTEANQQASPAAVGFWATYVKVAVGPPSTSTFVSCQIEEYGK